MDKKLQNRSVALSNAIASRALVPSKLAPPGVKANNSQSGWAQTLKTGQLIKMDMISTNTYSVYVSDLIIDEVKSDVLQRTIINLFKDNASAPMYNGLTDDESIEAFNQFKLKFGDRLKAGIRTWIMAGINFDELANHLKSHEREKREKRVINVLLQYGYDKNLLKLQQFDNAYESSELHIKSEKDEGIEVASGSDCKSDPASTSGSGNMSWSESVQESQNQNLKDKNNMEKMKKIMKGKTIHTFFKKVQESEYDLAGLYAAYINDGDGEMIILRNKALIDAKSNIKTVKNRTYSDVFQNTISQLRTALSTKAHCIELFGDSKHCSVCAVYDILFKNSYILTDALLGNYGVVRLESIATRKESLNGVINACEYWYHMCADSSPFSNTKGKDVMGTNIVSSDAPMNGYSLCQSFVNQLIREVFCAMNPHGSATSSNNAITYMNNSYYITFTPETRTDKLNRLRAAIYSMAAHLSRRGIGVVNVYVEYGANSGFQFRVILPRPSVARVVIQSSMSISIQQLTVGGTDRVLVSGIDLSVKLSNNSYLMKSSASKMAADFMQSELSKLGITTITARRSKNDNMAIFNTSNQVKASELELVKKHFADVGASDFRKRFYNFIANSICATQVMREDIIEVRVKITFGLSILILKPRMIDLSSLINLSQSTVFKDDGEETPTYDGNVIKFVDPNTALMHSLRISNQL